MDKEHKIDNQQDHDAVMKTINQRSKPNAVLRLLMNAFESYRQSRKLGWSRPWNKYNVINFQSFRLDKNVDTELLALTDNILCNECPGISKQALQFVDFLLHECQPLMGFIFVHEFMDEGQLYEGATLSLGCVNNKRYRDRLDLIVESPVLEGTSQGFSRLRVYVDPYNGEQDPLWYGCIEQDSSSLSSELFLRLSDISNQWQLQQEKHWNHWTSDYINYFGPRQHIVQNSFFYQYNPQNG